MTDVTHSQLVRAAALWLRRHARVVATEISTATSETPDAVGWGTNGTVVVECKVSREDFRRNSEKIHERSGDGIGDWRWFLVPQGLVTVSEVPDGWGLLEYRVSRHTNGYHLKVIEEAPKRLDFSNRFRAERLVLISVAQRALEAAAQVKPLMLGEESDALEEATDLVLDLYGQGCLKHPSGSDDPIREFQYDNRALSTYEEAEEWLIARGKLRPEQCLRRAVR